jgi:hypothetical protein
MTVPAPRLDVRPPRLNGFACTADEREAVESESLTGLPATRPYELHPRAAEHELPLAVLDEDALERIKRRIAKHLRGSGVLMLHEVAVPAAATMIDHLCIGPNGVTAIDVERIREGGDREALIRRVTRETEILAALLTEAGVRSEQIAGAVCHSGRLFGPRSVTPNGITFGHPRRVAKVARSSRGSRGVDVQLTLAVVRNRLGFADQRSYAITRPYES